MSSSHQQLHIIFSYHTKHFCIVGCRLQVPFLLSSDAFKELEKKKSSDVCLSQSLKDRTAHGLTYTKLFTEELCAHNSTIYPQRMLTST